MKRLLRCSLVVAFVLAIVSCSWALYIYSNNMEDGKVGEEYHASINFDDYYGLFYTTNWSYTGDFPPGLKFDDEGLGPVIISGTPTKAGSYTFSVTLINDYYPGHTQMTTKSFTINITGGSGGSGSGSGGGGSGSGSGSGSGESGGLSGGSGGGCETGLGIFALVIAATVLIRKLR